MGLWDILVPTEPGVLHNLITNPSFESNNVTVYGQTTNPTGIQNGTTNGLMHWTASSGTIITRSSVWSSQGAFSLKIAAGTVGAEKSVSYNPRATILPTPLLANITISTANPPPSGYTATIPNGKLVTISVMALNDIGMTLANNVTDIQNQYIYAYPNSSIAHPTIDGRRGHTDPVFCSPVTTILGNSIKISIKDTSTTIETRPRGWAVWYSYTDTGSTTLMFVLAAIVPNIHDGASTTPAGLTTVIDVLSIFPPIKIPSIAETGKISTSFSNSLTIFGYQTNFSSADVGKSIYILSNDNQHVYVGRIATHVNSTRITMENNTLATQLLNASFYLTNETNPQSFENNTQGGVSSFVYDSTALIKVIGALGLNATAPYFGITNSAYGDFTKKHHLYLDWSLSSPNTSNPNASYNDTGADWSVYLINNSASNPSTTLIGTLDVSSATSSAALRVGLRHKFLINRLSGNTSNMSIKIRYTGSNASTDADLYIDGVQFVDVGMIWRAYDWHNTTVSTYNIPLHFNDWDWDVVEFTYVDGDSPGAIWSDTMPTQSGTYVAYFPYFHNNGVWHANPNEYGALQSSGGYASPRFRLQSQWRNESSPVYGVSVFGLSQSSLQIQSTSLGFWVSLSTSNINVVVEPSTSGVGMPEIATTALEYGIIDGGFIQRQVSRMRTMQFTITISANSWLNLHASRRSFINLLKFDQLAQQGDRMLRYTGGGTPVMTSVTYQSGLDFNGVAQNASFTEVLQLRFLSADPYFYTQTSLVQDISPSIYNSDSSHIMYRLGNTAEWIPLSRHSSYEASGLTSFFDSLGKANSPSDIGWISSPSGNVSALVVGGFFVKPFSTIAFFTVSSFEQQNTDTLPNYTSVAIAAGNVLTSNTSTSTVTSSIAVFTAEHVGALLFTSFSSPQTTSAFIGIIQTVNSTTNVTLTTNAALTFNNSGWRLYVANTKTYTTPQNSVFGKQQFEFKADGVGETVLIDSILQETTRSVVVVGQFESVIELGTSFNGRVSTVRTYNPLTDSLSKYQNTRAIRFVMTDAGRIIAQPIDQIVSGKSNFYGFKSSLYDLLHYTDNVTNVEVNTRINGVASTDNNSYFFATNSQTQQSGNTYDSSFPQIISRSMIAFAKESVNSSVVYQDNSFNANFVGIRLTSLALGKISYSGTAPDSLLITGTGTNFFRGSFAQNINIKNWGGKSIFTAGGIYIGQIFYVISSTQLLLCEPPPFTFTNIEFEISLSADSVIVDNKTQQNTIYAALVSGDSPTLSWNTYMWAYINNPIAVGGVSILSKSRSIGTPPGLNYILGINNSGQINLANTASTAVNGVNTDFNTSMINNFILTSSNQIIGKIASITDKNNLNLYENSVTTISSPIGFVVRPTRYFTNSSGYQPTGGTILLSNDSVVRTNFESATTVGTYSSIEPAYTNLISIVGSATSVVNPFIFTDNTQRKAFLQTSTNLTGMILRRAATSAYNIDSNSQPTPVQLAGNGVGHVSSGAINVSIVQGNGTVTQSTNQGQITFTVSNGLFQQTDVMRTMYASDGTNYQFVGVIIAVFSNTEIQLNYIVYPLSGTYYLSGVSVMAGVGSITSIDDLPTASAGTISITSGTKAVVGVGTSFVAGDVGKDIYYEFSGSYIFIGRIALRISTTSVALVNKWTGTTLSGTVFYLNIYTVTGSGTAFTELDVGKNLYDYSGNNVGIIAKHYSATSVALASSPLISINSGLSYGLSTPLYFYQFPLYSTTFTAGANVFSSTGMINDIDIASGTTTSIALNYAPMSASQINPVPHTYAAYAYVNYTNQWLGEVTSHVATITNTFSTATAAASTITVTANTKTVTAAAASFVAGDVGKNIFFLSTTGIFLYLGTIATFTSTTVVILVDNYTGATLSARGFTKTNSANITGVSAGNPFLESDVNRKLYATVAGVFTYIGTILSVTTNTTAGSIMAILTLEANIAIIGQSLVFGNSSITIGSGTAFAIPAFTPISLMPYTTVDTSAAMATTGESIYKVGHELIGINYLGTIAKIKSTFELKSGTISVALNGTVVTGVSTSFLATDIGSILYNSLGVTIGTIGSRTSATSVTLVSGALVAVTAAVFNISNSKIVFSYLPYQSSGILGEEFGIVYLGGLIYVSAKTLRGSQVGDYWADVVGHISAQSASIINVTTTALFSDIPSTILPNINLAINTTKNAQQFIATAGVDYLTIVTIAGTTNITLSKESTAGALVADANAFLLAGRPIFTNATPAIYTGTVNLAKSTTEIVLEQGARVAIATTAYKTTAMSFKYGLAPGDVVRHLDGRLIGQVKSIDIANLRVYLTDNAIITYTGQVLIQRGLGLGLGIGKIVAFNSVVGQVTGSTSLNNFTLFKQLPLNYSGAITNVNIRIYLNKNEELVDFGNVQSVSSDSSMFVGGSIPSFNNESYEWYYLLEYTASMDNLSNNYSFTNSILPVSPEYPSIPWMAGLGIITGVVANGNLSIGVVTGLAAPNLTLPSTRFIDQLYPGVTVFIYSTTGLLLLTGIVTKVVSNSLITVSIRYFDVINYPAGSLPNDTYYWHYVVTPNETTSTTTGDNAFISNDWQPLGKQDGVVKVIKNTINGDIFVGGKFTKWADKSQSLRIPTVWRNVFNIAKLVISTAGDVITEAYATPIVGTSYTRNGISGPINDLEDVSEINPINGYVGSGDKLIVGGDFYSTLNNEILLPGLAYIEGNTMTNSMRPVINTEVEPLKLSGNPGAVKKIAVTNRLRPYNGLINTNILDGINGSNIAVLFTEPVYAKTKMRYSSIRVRGNASTYPVITIINPTSSILSLFSLYQTETGARLLFVNSKISLAPNERIVIDLRVGKRSIISNIRGNVISYLHPLSNFVDWIFIGANSAAGANTQSTDDYHLNVVGVHADYGITVTISYTPRFWSFDTNDMFFGTTKAGL